MTIDEYILSHSDEEGALLSALNRDANVNLLVRECCRGICKADIEDVLPDASSPPCA